MALLVAGGLVLLGLGAGGTWLLTGRGDSGVQPAAAATSPVPGGQPAGAEAAGSTPTGEPAPTSDPTPPDYTDWTNIESPATVMVNPGQNPGYPSGSWILVLDSLPVTQFTYDQAVGRAAALPNAVVVDSSTVPGLKPGYWAITSNAWYGTAREASGRCPDYGRVASGACYPRKVTG